MDLADFAISVKPMREEHIAAVMDIERDSFSSPWPDTAYRRDLSGNDKAFHVVLCPSLPPAPGVAEEIWAFGGSWLMVDEAHVMTLATRRDKRRRGFGEVVLLELIGNAQRRQARCATLEVRASNLAAQGLYNKYGFEVVGRRKAYYPDNREDALIMTTPSFLDLGFRHLLATNWQQLGRRLSSESSQKRTEL